MIVECLLFNDFVVFIEELVAEFLISNIPLDAFGRFPESLVNIIIT